MREARIVTDLASLAEIIREGTDEGCAVCGAAFGDTAFAIIGDLGDCLVVCYGCAVEKDERLTEYSFGFPQTPAPALAAERGKGYAKKHGLGYGFHYDPTKSAPGEMFADFWKAYREDAVPGLQDPPELR